MFLRAAECFLTQNSAFRGLVGEQRLVSVHKPFKPTPLVEKVVKWARQLCVTLQNMRRDRRESGEMQFVSACFLSDKHGRSKAEEYARPKPQLIGRPHDPVTLF